MGWGAQGSVQAYRGNYLDLDPTYTNEHGQPLMRMTFDWGKHERKYSDWLIGNTKRWSNRSTAELRA